MSFELNADEERRLADALSVLDTTADEASAMESASPRDVFCRYWPITRQVLGFLRDLPVTPGPVRAAVALVIAAGDAAAKIIC